jgi:large subunit ribosomal protein L6
MSRIGKKPINIPEKVTVKIEPGKVTIKGPKGELSQVLHKDVTVKQDGNNLTVSVKEPEEKFNRSLWGTTASLLNNMVEGVVNGFSKNLEISGVGFTWEAKPDKIVLKVGYSHPVEYVLPKGIEAKIVKNVLTISGIDKHLVGAAAAEIRAIKKPEPYKGKGIKYAHEIIKRKAGKQAVSSAS